MVALIRPERCDNCKHRVIEGDGSKRCHWGPPQRVVYPAQRQVPGPDGKPIVQMGIVDETSFPLVADDFWCGQFGPKIIAPR